MGCNASSLKSRRDAANKKGANGRRKKGDYSDTATKRSHSRGHTESRAPDDGGKSWWCIGRSKTKDSRFKGARSASGSHYTTEVDVGATWLAELCTIIDDMTEVSSSDTSSSSPQLFRVTPTTRAGAEPGTVAWWRQELRRERVTRDSYRRMQLQDIHAQLAAQCEEDPSRVELDLSNSFMERSAPYVLGRLFASREFKELRWITSLRLDGNYFTDDGFGAMLAIMSAANEEQRIMPSLRQIYFNNMNLDRHSVAGLFAYLFPVDRKATRGISPKKAFRIAGSRFSGPPEAYIPSNESSPMVPLFPSLTVLSLSDNPGIGTAGLVEILRSFLAFHYEPCTIAVVDLSRCGMDREASQYLRDYFKQLPKAMKGGFHPVVPQRFVLMGNQHGITNVQEVQAQGNTAVQLVL
ncbi:hypothetical protein JKF63_05901 [Porcisia hertigi]|uniref:Leucine-rich domain-containing protein n=1 Tax=Porcisia hertigi TaxID=2761500 RepID=A0A836IX51_9TRYP|nr:hypothetical protein JKF63_05901 [Porcisia hertigi]